MKPHQPDHVIVESSVKHQSIWLDWPGLILFWVLIAIVAAQFITRYLLNDSLSWTEEIARYLLMSTAFLGGISCVHKGKHIFLEVFYRYLKREIIKPVIIVVEVIVFVFFAYLGYLSIELSETTSQRMASIDVPKNVIYYVVMFSCCASAIVAARNVLVFCRLSSQELCKRKLTNLTA